MAINIGSNATLSLGVSNSLIEGGTADVVTLIGSNDTLVFEAGVLATGDILTIAGTSNNDTVHIGSGGTVILQGAAGTQDFVTGTAGDDVFFAGAGNDTYTGIASDTANYGLIGEAITLDALGVVQKAGGLGTDTLDNIGTIVGEAGKANVINATLPPGSSGTTSVTVDLLTDSLKVNNIPTIGDLAFIVENFSTVIGTTGNDTITANAGTDVFFGSAGNDIYNGSTVAGASDTLNYSLIGAAITLDALGVVQKAGGLGTDTLRNIDTIIGEAGKANVINATLPPGTPGTTSVTVDLLTDSLKVNNIPTIGDLAFIVENFSTVIGTTGNDTITANAGTDVFFGSAGNDIYNGSTVAGAGDTVNYSLIGQAVTLVAPDMVRKGGGLGTDTLTHIGTLVGTIVVSGFETILGSAELGPDGSVSAGAGSTVLMSANGGATPAAGAVQTAAAATPDALASSATISLTSGSITVYTNLGLDTIQFAGSGNTIVNQGGTAVLTDSGSGNAFVLPAAGSGEDVISGNVLNNNDVFDLTSALAGTDWNGSQSTIGNYVQVTTVGSNAVVSINPTGSGAGDPILTIDGAGGLTLSRFLSHSVT